MENIPVSFVCFHLLDDLLPGFLPLVVRDLVYNTMMGYHESILPGPAILALEAANTYDWHQTPGSVPFVISLHPELLVVVATFNIADRVTISHLVVIRKYRNIIEILDAKCWGRGPVLEERVPRRKGLRGVTSASASYAIVSRIGDNSMRKERDFPGCLGCSQCW